MQVQHRTAPSWTSSVQQAAHTRGGERLPLLPRRRGRGGRCGERQERVERVGNLGGSLFKKKRERKRSVRPPEMILYFQLAPVPRRKDSLRPNASTASPLSLPVSPLRSLFLFLSVHSLFLQLPRAVPASVPSRDQLMAFIWREGETGGERDGRRERERWVECLI